MNIWMLDNSGLTTQPSLTASFFEQNTHLYNNLFIMQLGWITK